MPSLYTIAFPKLSATDQDWLAETRSQFDPNFTKINPHFTLLFGCAEISLGSYCNHVAMIAEKTDAFQFQCNQVSPETDYFSSEGYIFLTPEKGACEIKALHGALYQGIMSPYLKTEIPFTPHITVGRRDSVEDARKTCEKLNRHPISISGTVEALTVVEENQGCITEKSSFALS